jgi:hypothetical protein
MNTQLLGSSIEALLQLRAELHGSVEDSVMETLDKVISDLEAIQQHSDKISAIDVLNIIGEALQALPAIAELIRILSAVIK